MYDSEEEKANPKTKPVGDSESDDPDFAPVNFSNHGTDSNGSSMQDSMQKGHAKDASLQSFNNSEIMSRSDFASD